MTFNEAIAGLGVSRDMLTATEKLQLDDFGYLMIDGVLTPSGAARMRGEMQRIFDDERTLQPGGPPECNQMQNKSDAFDVCLTHPKFLAAIWHVLGYNEFVAMGVNSRPNLPGKGAQGLHVDFAGPPCKTGDYFVCNSIWTLCGFTRENGATRVIPGSHRWARHPGEALKDPVAPHPQEIQVEAPLGAVIVFNSHLWHSAMLNRSNADRPNLTSYFSRRMDHAGKAVSNSLGKQAWDRLKPARCLFDPPGGSQWRPY